MSNRLGLFLSTHRRCSSLLAALRCRARCRVTAAHAQAAADACRRHRLPPAAALLDAVATAPGRRRDRGALRHRVRVLREPGRRQGRLTLASMLLGSYKVTPEFAPLVRLGVVSNSPPDGTDDCRPAPRSRASVHRSSTRSSAARTCSSSRPTSSWRRSSGLTVPIGSGGGDKPDPSVARGERRRHLRALGDGQRDVRGRLLHDLSRASTSRTSNHGVTVQVEATLLQLLRVRGKGTPTGDDSSRTNLTAGLHVGYFFIPQLSAGAELRHQRWLSTPGHQGRGRDADRRAGRLLRDTTTVALGLRGHFKLSDTIWLRPGIAYARGLDDPMSDRRLQHRPARCAAQFLAKRRVSSTPD